jgi:hypothetical protein
MPSRERVRERERESEREKREDTHQAGRLYALLALALSIQSC